MILFADITTDAWTALAHQGPYVGLLALLLLTGYRRAWIFTSQADRENKLKDELIAEKELRLVRVEQELVREREEKEMYRQYTLRLLETTRAQIPLVTEAVVGNRRG